MFEFRLTDAASTFLAENGTALLAALVAAVWAGLSAWLGRRRNLKLGAAVEHNHEHAKKALEISGNAYVDHARRCEELEKKLKAAFERLDAQLVNLTDHNARLHKLETDLEAREQAALPAKKLEYLRKLAAELGVRIEPSASVMGSPSGIVTGRIHGGPNLDTVVTAARNQG